MVPLPSLAEIPQLQALQSQVRLLWAGGASIASIPSAHSYGVRVVLVC